MKSGKTSKKAASEDVRMLRWQSDLTNRTNKSLEVTWSELRDCKNYWDLNFKCNYATKNLKVTCVIAQITAIQTAWAIVLIDFQISISAFPYTEDKALLYVLHIPVKTRVPVISNYCPPCFARTLFSLWCPKGDPASRRTIFPSSFVSCNNSCSTRISLKKQTGKKSGTPTSLSNCAI